MKPKVVLAGQWTAFVLELMTLVAGAVAMLTWGVPWLEANPPMGVAVMLPLSVFLAFAIVSDWSHKEHQP